MKERMFNRLSRVLNKSTQNQLIQEENRDRQNTPEVEKFEHCILCGRITKVPTYMPIELRENYEVGCGQICDECARK